MSSRRECSGLMEQLCILIAFGYPIVSIHRTVSWGQGKPAILQDVEF